MTRPLRVAIAMSGGVDSSVAAALLVEQGHDVVGLMLRLWQPEDGSGLANRCCSPEDMANARLVANNLGIPFYVVDARAAFWNWVVGSFVSGYTQGVTPNPCIACNRHIRWGFLLHRARALGADRLATGHYARLRTSPDGSRLLLRARDRAKDQSYILSVLDQSALACTLFPLGEFTKPEVRDFARARGLPIAERPESQDLCFVGQSDYRAFLHTYADGLPSPGPIVNLEGKRLGTHPGLYNFTIGQRKGIGLQTGVRTYVIRKEPDSQTLVVGPWHALGRTDFTAGPVNWVSGMPPQVPFHAQVRVRYQADEVAATIYTQPIGTASVTLERPLADITPGQQAVFYDGEVCLGGGTIQA